MYVLAGAVLGLSFWQLAFGGVVGGSSGQGTVCDGLRPSVWTTGTVTTTCVWSEPNAAVRILAGFLTFVVFSLFLLKVTRFRTDRKIVYVLLVAVSWVGTTCWLVLAGWDANEIRVAAERCSSLSNATCSSTPFIITVIIDILLWITGWIFSIFFSVWMKKEDYKRVVGLCGGGRGRHDRSAAASASLPMPSAPIGELEDF